MGKQSLLRTFCSVCVMVYLKVAEKGILKITPVLIEQG